MESLTQRVGSNVATAITTAGYNRKQVAEATSIPYTTLNRHINGHGDGFPVSQLQRIADELNLDAASFFKVTP